MINKETNTPYSLDELKNYKNITTLKHLSDKTMKKTQKASVGLYILNLGVLMSSLGFVLPALLNRMLRKRVAEDKVKLNTFTSQLIVPTMKEFLK